MPSTNIRYPLSLALSSIVLCCLGGATAAQKAKPGASAAPVAATATTAPDAAAAEYFEIKVRPALVKYCYDCHSQTAHKSLGGLSLDSRKAMMTGGTQGPALAPGAPDGSRLIEAMRYKNPDLQMPPAGKLPDTVISEIAEWVRMGAPWPETHTTSASTPAHGVTATAPTALTAAEQLKRKHWAWQPVRLPAVPRVKRGYWPKNPIDNFILAKLESKNLTPSPYADRRTLIRRAYFDLIGLPPTPEEVADFAADKSADAWAKVIDRLLANPHYGERWGRYWLDLARYGEDQAHSFEPRLYPQGFRYRDWVANSLNSDMPYDQFVREQIAADLLEEPEKQTRLAALGFFALGPVYYGDGKMFDQYDDRVDTLSRGVLALTVACARCHDHKFDPISQKDYYGLAGVFASSAYIESPISMPDSSGSTTKPDPSAAIVNRNDDINKKASELDKFVSEQQAQFRARYTPEISRYIVSVWRLRNHKKAQPKASVEQAAAADKLDAVVLERWASYLDKPADSDHDQPHLAAWRQLIKSEDPKKDLSANPDSNAEVRKVADGVQASVESLMKRRDEAEKQQKDATKPGTEKKEKETKAKPLDKTEMAVLDEVTGTDGVLTVPQDKLDGLLNGDPKLRFGILTAELKRLKMGSFVHTLTEGPKTVNLPVLARGNPEAPGQEEPRHFLSILSGDGAAPCKQGSGRLELANAIADKRNPLTARVMVNRVWQHHFGLGIVRTASNFGVLGEPPSNPDLLDYLTSRFVSEGWSLKRLHRQIMLSAAYQMSGASDPHKFEVDPDNRLVWRMARRRLEVEAWRDSMLAVSGTLDLTLGGPSLQLASADNHRRTYYAAVSRHDLDAMLRLFDYPDPNATIDTRMSTTVPLQQLFVLNSEYMARQAKAFAARLNAKPGNTDADRVREAFALAFERAPSVDELALALNFLSGPRAPGATSGTTAASIQPAGPRKDGLSRWEQYAQVLLSSNEFMYID